MRCSCQTLSYVALRLSMFGHSWLKQYGFQFCLKRKLYNMWCLTNSALIITSSSLPKRQQANRPIVERVEWFAWVHKDRNNRLVFPTRVQILFMSCGSQSSELYYTLSKIGNPWHTWMMYVRFMAAIGRKLKELLDKVVKESKKRRLTIDGHQQ